VRYRNLTTLRLFRLHRRLLYDARLQLKIKKKVAVQGKCGLHYCLTVAFDVTVA